MLSALDENGNLINLLDKQMPKKQQFSCPACQSPVRLKKGLVMRPHFAHIALQDCQFYTENESAEHLSLKAELYRALSRTEQVTIERVLPDLGQIADLLINEHLVLEVQCSRLSEKRLRERTQAYQKADFQVLWLLGRKLWLGERLSSFQKQCVYFSQNMGFHLWELDFERREIRIKYLIYEDWHGRVHYLTKTCSFDKDVMAFFRLPYQKQPLSTYEVAQDQELLSYIQRQVLARNPVWLKRQEEAYLQFGNLLTNTLDDFYPQVRPLESASGFCQIRQDLSAFRAAFFHYYQKQKQTATQQLYPPAFYGKMGAREKR